MKFTKGVGLGAPALRGEGGGRMGKRMIAACVIAVLLWTLCPGVYAGDLPEAIRNMTNIDVIICRVTSQLHFASLKLNDEVSKERELI